MVVERNKKKVTCPSCGWHWETSGRRKYVTCPNCFCNFIPEDEKIMLEAQKKQAESRHEQ